MRTMISFGVRRFPPLLFPLFLAALAIVGGATNAWSMDLKTMLEHSGSDHFQRGVDNLRKPAEARREFALAAKDFHALHDEGVRSPALYLALGNAEALAGRWARAIWAYHSGLALDPNHGPLRDHLNYARGLVNYPPGNCGRPAPEIWPPWLHRPSAADLFVLAAAAHGLAWLTGGWWYLRRGTLPGVLTAGLFAIAIAGGIGGILTERGAASNRQHPLAIVADDGTPLQRGNGPSYPLHPDVATLAAGLETRILHTRGSWLQVQLTTGEVGWVEGDRVLVVAGTP